MGLQGHRITRPTCSLNLHSPTSYVRGCNSLSVKSKQRRGNLVDYACDITSNLTDIPSEQDDWIVVTHPGSNNPWKCVGCRDIFPTSSAFLKHLLTVHQIRHIMYKCDCDFTSENSHSVGVHKPYCTVILLRYIVELTNVNAVNFRQILKTDYLFTSLGPTPPFITTN